MGWAILVAVLLVASSSAKTFHEGDNYDADYSYTFYKLAGASYCPDVEKWECKPCVASNQTLKSVLRFSNSSTDTVAYVAAYDDINTGDTNIIVSFRGTETLTNWLENLRIAKTDRQMSCSGCKVHSGFLDSWTPIATPVVNEIRRLQFRYPSARLYTTGHSLGGALAVVAAYCLEYDHHLKIAGVFTYGQPRVGNKEFADFYNLKSDTHVTWRITHHRDIVPHLPERLFGFYHEATEVYYGNDGPADGSYRVCDGSGEDPQCSDQYVITAVSVWDHLHYFGEAIGVDAC
jgi:hypothetical protein